MWKAKKEPNSFYQCICQRIHNDDHKSWHICYSKDNVSCFSADTINKWHNRLAIHYKCLIRLRISFLRPKSIWLRTEWLEKWGQFRCHFLLMDWCFKKFVGSWWVISLWLPRLSILWSSAILNCMIVTLSLFVANVICAIHSKCKTQGSISIRLLHLLPAFFLLNVIMSRLLM